MFLLGPLAHRCQAWHSVLFRNAKTLEEDLERFGISR